MYAEYKRRAIMQDVNSIVYRVLSNLCGLSSRFWQWNNLKLKQETDLISLLSSGSNLICVVFAVIVALSILCVVRVNLSVFPMTESLLVIVQYKGENRSEYSRIVVEKYNHALNSSEEILALRLEQLKDFGVVLHQNTVFVLGGKNNNGHLNSVCISTEN